MSKKNIKRTFEDNSGSNAIYLGDVLSYEGEPVSDFAIIVYDADNKESSVTILNKSEIPRLIKQLLKIMVSKPKKVKKTRIISFTLGFSFTPDDIPF